ncbi:MAG: DrmE family protein [Deltaproteobacteria bacterium]|nr:DrmE family protein [Deltaproteobacteria bacterium]
MGDASPVVIFSGSTSRAADYLDTAGHGVGTVVLDATENICADHADLRRLLDAGVPVLAFVPEDGEHGERIALLADCKAGVWGWNNDELEQLLPHEDASETTLGRYERRLSWVANFKPETVALRSKPVEGAFEAFLRMRRVVIAAEVQPVVEDFASEALGGIIAMMRSMGRGGEHRNEMLQIAESLEKDRFIDGEVRAAVAQVREAILGADEALERENPKQLALARMLQMHPESRVLMDVPQDLDETQIQVPVIIPGWFGRRQMSRFLTPPAATSLTMLLYGPELRWYSAWLERNRLLAKQRQMYSKRDVFPGLSRSWKRQQEVAKPSIIQDPVPDLDLHQVEIHEARSRRFLQNTIQSAEPLVDATALIFKGGSAAFLTQGYVANVITHLFSGLSGATSEAEVLQRRATALRQGDVLLFAEGDRDAIRDCADKLLAPGIREKTRYWQQALRSWAKHGGKSVGEICSALAEHGCSRHPVTVREWLKNDDIIGPRLERDIRCIAAITGDQALSSNLTECEDAIATVRGAHHRAAVMLAEKVVAAAAQQLAGDDCGVLHMDSVAIVTLEFVSDRLRPVPRSRVNRLLFHADQQQRSGLHE